LHIHTPLVGLVAMDLSMDPTTSDQILPGSKEAGRREIAVPGAGSVRQLKAVIAKQMQAGFKAARVITSDFLPVS